MIPDRIDRPLHEWVPEQRWFASKAREVAELNELVRLPLSDDPELELVLVEARFATGTHELYQLLPGGPGGADALGALLRADAEVGEVSFHGSGRPDGHVRDIGAEQSNSSLIYGDADVLKVFRRLEPGDNPELEMLRYLSARGFPNIAQLTGWYEFSGELMDATLGVMQAYVPEARDGWELALDDPEGVAARIGELGDATGRMHTLLGSEAINPDFAPEEPSIEALSLLTATIDEEIERVFRDLPDGLPALEPIAGRSEELRDRLQMMSHVGVGGRLIRHHGDYHLGQTLLTDERWVILDFEGEPARPLLERRRKRSPLRDVAGMLRSFAYAASWELRVREAFLDAYLEAVEPALLPAGRDATEKLLAIFELDKAVYELRYELNNRPDWVAIPVAGIARLLEQELAR
jgi:maltokinase